MEDWETCWGIVVLAICLWKGVAPPAWVHFCSYLFWAKMFGIKLDLSFQKFVRLLASFLVFWPRPRRANQPLLLWICVEFLCKIGWREKTLGPTISQTSWHATIPSTIEQGRLLNLIFWFSKPKKECVHPVSIFSLNHIGITHNTIHYIYSKI